jgi:hypothetical protein
MRNEWIGLAGMLVILGTATAGGCSSSPTAPSSGPSCPGLTAPCGGSVVGTLTANASCLTVSGPLDVSGVGFDKTCANPTLTGSLKVTGTWIANSDGTYTDNTVTTGDEKFSLGPECKRVSSTPVDCSSGVAGFLSAFGYSTLTCKDAANGGCDCIGKVGQMGGFGTRTNAPSTNGSYTTSANGLKTADGTSYSHCVSGDTVTIAPQSMSPILTGTVTFTKSSTPSGSSGSAGSSSGSMGSASSGSSSGSSGSSGGPSGSSGGAASSSGGSSSSGSSGGSSGMGSSGATSLGTGPCDIFATGGNPCVAAHSTVRALYSSYKGNLYQVKRTDNTTLDVGTTAAGGFASTAAQDTFCAGSACVITVVYDQSGKGNDLWYQGSTTVPGSTVSLPSTATTESLKISGNKVYALYIKPNNSYWRDGSKSGLPLGAAPEAMYMVTSGTHSNGGCCFDYGNSESDRKADGAGAMDAINLSSTTAWGTGAGSGPWVMADLEYGLFAEGDTKKNQNDPTQTVPYVTAILKNNGMTEFSLKGGNAQSGSLTSFYKGPLPGGWSPMKKQGAIVLGSGGDCCKPGGGANASQGTFYEGAIVTGYPPDATDDALQANIVLAGYGK